MTTTKNTTAAERRIRRRQALAEALNSAAKAVEAIGARSDFMREAATELLIGNTEIVLGQQWATDAPQPQAEPAVDEVMIGRAVDAWEQYTGGFTGPHDYLFRRAAMRHALEQALGVRS